MNATEPQTEPASSKFLDPKANLKRGLRIIVIALVLLGGVWLLIRSMAGEKAANQVAATVLKRPIELANSVENMEASSFKGFPLSLPYTGTVTIEATILKGNELDISVVEESEVENVKNGKPFKRLAGFEATKTKNFQRSGRLEKGKYYLVCTDSTFYPVAVAAKSSVPVFVEFSFTPTEQPWDCLHGDFAFSLCGVIDGDQQSTFGFERRFSVREEVTKLWRMEATRSDQDLVRDINFHD